MKCFGINVRPLISILQGAKKQTITPVNLSLQFCLGDDFSLVVVEALLVVGRVSGLLYRQCWVFAFVILHDGVREDGEHQDRQQDVQFGLQTQEGAVGEGDNETQGLPHPVVSERSLFVPRKEDPVKSCGTESREM